MWELFSRPAKRPGDGYRLKLDESVDRMESHQKDELVGHLIGDKYRLLERLDSTGQARVYRAEQVHLGRVVALKLGDWRVEENEPAFKRLSRTARMAAKVQSPRIAAVFDVGTDPAGYVYLAMEMCKGTDLRHRVEGGGTFSVELAVEIVRQVLDGLAAAHKNDVVHGGLSPKYVMVREKNPGEEGPEVSVKLVGFGLSEWEMGVSGSVSARGGEGVLQGKGFVAPEVISGALPDGRADLYSTAVLLFYLMTGLLPWEEGSLDIQDSRRWYEHRVRYALEDNEWADSLLEFFRTGLSPEPQNRFDSAAQMKEGLNSALSGQKSEYSQISQRQEAFGRFRLLRMLARGGMGELHLAITELEMGQARAVALKTLRPDLAARKDFLNLFLEEARLTSRLSHPNLVRVHEVGKVDGRYYMTLEYVVGKDARRILERARTDRMPVPAEVAVYIVRELCEALAYSHRIQTPSGLGLVHADVSPTNVLVSFEGGVKLIDFGLAQRVRISSTMERKRVIGKLGYLAPEQLEGQTLDARTDIYAAGLLLFELLTGTRYHDADTEEALKSRILEGPQRVPSQIVPSVPEALDSVVCKALARDPKRRYKRTEALRDDLSEVLSRLRPRMSRDHVASYLRQLFPSEYKTETQLSLSLFSKTPQVTVETALSFSQLQAISGDMDSADDEVTLPAYSIPKDLAKTQNLDPPPPTSLESKDCLGKTATMSVSEMEAMGVFDEEDAGAPHRKERGNRDEVADTDPGLKAVRCSEPQGGEICKDDTNGKKDKKAKKKRRFSFFGTRDD